MECSWKSDNVLGPVVSRCRGGFDFTLLFEQAIFSTIPSVLLLIACAWRCGRIYRWPQKTVSSLSTALKYCKQVPIWCFVATQLALVVLWASPKFHPTQISVAASVLSLAVALALSVLSFLEHDRSVRPSSLLSIYLFVSVLLDAPQARTLCLRDCHSPPTVLFLVGLVFRFCILLLEVVEKRSFLKIPYQSWPPEALAGTLNRNVFWWLNALFLRGYSGVLILADLFHLDPALTSENVHPRFRRTWDAEVNKRSPYALVKVTTRCLWRPMMATVAPRLLLIGLKICQPLLTHRAVSLLSEPDSQSKTNAGRALIGATALMYAGIAFSTARYKQNTNRLLSLARCGLVGLIYDATLQLPMFSTGRSAAVTLMSTDVERIVSALQLIDSLWAGPIEFAISIYLLNQQIGVFCVTSVVLALVFVGFPVLLGGITANAQKDWMQAVEDRVATTASSLSQMRGIKMLGWSEQAKAILHGLRVGELDVSVRFRRILTITLAATGFLRTSIPAATFIIYMLVTRANSHINLDPALAFTSLSLISLLTDPLKLVCRAITPVAASEGCFQRIQEYLNQINPTQQSMRDSCSEGPVTDSEHVMSQKDDSHMQVDLREVYSEANNQSLGCIPEKTSEDSLMQIQDADFVFDQPHSKGSYALRNITLDLQRGFMVILGPVGSGKSTLLLGMLNELHLTRGSLRRTLSQQMAYCAQNPWIPHLSVREIISGDVGFDRAWYSTVLRTCALERDIQQMPQKDHTLVGNQGARLSGGQRQRLSLARAVYSRREILLLDDTLSAVDASTEQVIADNLFGANGLCRQMGMTVVLATNTARYAHQADHVVIMQSPGSIVKQGRPFEVDLDDIGPLVSSPAHSVGRTPEIIIEDDESPRAEPSRESHPDSWRRTGDRQVYWYYSCSLGQTIAIGVAVGLSIAVFTMKFPTVLLKWWSNAEDQDPGAKTSRYAGVYGGLSIMNMISFYVTTYLLEMVASRRSSIALHAKLLRTVMAAPLWLFSTDCGGLINRFSQDMSLIDMELPGDLVDFLFTFGVCIMEAGLVASASQWVALAYPVLLAVLYLVQKFYLRTSRQMRLLDLEAKSPLYAHFLETLEGLTTIRAFGWQGFSAAQNIYHLDNSQRPFYLMYSIQQWLTFVLDMIVTVLATFVMALATQVTGSSAGSLGVSLVSILSFSQNLCYLIQSWTRLETSIGAVARVKQLEEDTPSENAQNEQQQEPPAQWPPKGAIHFSNIAASYSATAEPVLKEFSLSIAPGQKVGICGRTGSGKSTLILALLRLIDLTEGEIAIDGIPVSATPRDTLRRRAITAMPQDPLILPGSIRSNMDPFSQYPEEAIISVFEEVQLWSTISARGGLDVSADSLALSRGQQQLFCLARVLLSESPIVVFDEVTANVDRDTAARVMEIINTKFVSRTVLVIAHQLWTIRQFDHIAVLEQGRLIELGDPEELLQQETAFRRLWRGHHAEGDS